MQLFFKSGLRAIIWFLILSATALLLFFVAGYFAAFKAKSYLPEILVRESYTESAAKKLYEIKTNWYTIQVYENARITVKSINNETIMSDLYYYTEIHGGKEQSGLKNTKIQKTNDSIITIEGTGMKNVLVAITLQASKNTPVVEIKTKTKYSQNTLVRRESLVAKFDIPVSEVYLKNRKAERENFESEYWLQKEGARFGKAERSALVYHTPFISSIQLDVKKALLFFNLDYYLDHPHINIPPQKDGGGIWKDISVSEYIAGTERTNSFTINFGSLPYATPRLMLVPSGYLAGYVFTEHADGGNIRTERAIYFGNEDISKVKDAIGGFVGHKIPTTKSVFYSGKGDRKGAAIIENGKYSELLDFLDQIYSTGLYDICLHTPEDSTSNHEILAESIGFMKERYNAVSWIDHGFYSGKINREAFVAEGLDSSSLFYAADLWKEYNTKYFWSPAVELIRDSSKVSITGRIKEFRFFDAYVNIWKQYINPKELQELSFFQAAKELLRRYSDKFETNSQLPNQGNAYPTPLYWQHPTLFQGFYSWTTDYVKEYSDLSDKRIEREKYNLTKLINDQGVFFNHGYYVRYKESEDMMTLNDDKLSINPGFDKILGIMAGIRDKGDLNITTVSSLINYWIILENISFEYSHNGDIYIYNRNKVPVNGLSIAINAQKILINGKRPSMRHHGEDSIFWFDIQGNSKVTLQIVN